MDSTSKNKQHSKKPDKAVDFDIQMLQDNLKLTYAERIRRHQIACDTMQKLKKAKFL